MEEEHHLNPRSKSPYNTEQNPPKPSNKCLVYALALITLLAISLLIFALAFLRIRSPTLRISNITIRDTNTYLDLQVQLHNANFGRFTFQGGNVTMLHGNATVGMAKIGSGSIGRGKKRGFNLTMKMSTNFSRSGIVVLGVIGLRSYSELGGEVRVIKIIKGHKKAVMNCTMDLNITSKNVENLWCG